MLRGNLSTRPFYNERLVNLVLLLLAAAGIALAIFNTSRTLYLTDEESRRTVVQRQAEAETARLRGLAAKEEGRVDRRVLLDLGAQTSDANILIDARTFSWTTFFDIVERKIPLDLRMISVAPRVDRGVFKIVITVNAKKPSDVEDFVNALMDTGGAFVDMIPTDLHPLEDGTWISVLEGGYVSHAPPSNKPASAGGHQ